MEAPEPRSPATAGALSRRRRPLFIAAVAVLILTLILIVAGAPAVRRGNDSVVLPPAAKVTRPPR